MKWNLNKPQIDPHKQPTHGNQSQDGNKKQQKTGSTEGTKEWESEGEAEMKTARWTVDVDIATRKWLNTIGEIVSELHNKSVEGKDHSKGFDEEADPPY